MATTHSARYKELKKEVKAVRDGYDYEDPEQFEEQLEGWHKLYRKAEAARRLCLISAKEESLLCERIYKAKKKVEQWKREDEAEEAELALYSTAEKYGWRNDSSATPYEYLLDYAY